MRLLIRKRLAFSLRTLLVFCFLVSLLAFFETRRARRQCQAVATIENAGGWVSYADTNRRYRRLLGDDVAGTVDAVGFNQEPVTDRQASVVADLPCIDSLDLSFTPITDESMKAVGSCRMLVYLDLRGTAVTSAGIRHLKSLMNLKYLELDDTQIDDDALEHLASLSNLQSLQLSGTRISDSGLRHLTGLTSLESLAIDRTRVRANADELMSMFHGVTCIDLNRAFICESTSP